MQWGQKKESCQPISRILYPAKARPPSFISDRCHHRPRSAYPSRLPSEDGNPASSQAPVQKERNRDVHGISTHKVCPPPDLHRDAVRSYRTFSPLPQPTARAVVFCDTLCPQFPGAHRLGGVVLYVVRTFLTSAARPWRDGAVDRTFQL